MSEVAINDLLEAGVHFGHQTKRWNPKMKKFIFTERNNIYIIDLKKTQQLLTKACDSIREITAKGEAILFVGTKPQAAAIIKEESIRCSQFYVTNRWLGGMLTNYRTIRQSIKRLDHIEKMAADGTYEQLTKKEVLTHEKHREKLSNVLDGIREMNRIPGLVIVVDTKKEKIAVSEANRLGIPVCAILDTNCDPDPITYPIPGNDDAIRSIQLLLSHLTEAIIEGMQLRVDETVVTEKEQGAGEKQKEDDRSKKRRPSKGKREGKKEHTKKPEKRTVAKEEKTGSGDVTNKAGAPESTDKQKKTKKKSDDKTSKPNKTGAKAEPESPPKPVKSKENAEKETPAADTASLNDTGKDTETESGN